MFKKKNNKIHCHPRILQAPVSGEQRWQRRNKFSGYLWRDTKPRHPQAAGDFKTAKGSKRSTSDMMLSYKEQALMLHTHTHTIKVQCLEAKVIWLKTKLLSQPELLTRSQNKRNWRLNNRKGLRNCWGQQLGNNRPLHSFVCVSVCACVMWGWQHDKGY